MTEIYVFVGMLLCAGLPFIGLTGLMRAGQSGWALTVGSIIGAMLVILIFASGTPIGINPIFAMTLAMLAFVPALLGVLAGALLGWLLRRQDDRQV